MRGSRVLGLWMVLASWLVASACNGSREPAEDGGLIELDAAVPVADAHDVDDASHRRPDAAPSEDLDSSAAPRDDAAPAEDVPFHDATQPDAASDATSDGGAEDDARSSDAASEDASSNEDAANEDAEPTGDDAAPSDLSSDGGANGCGPGIACLVPACAAGEITFTATASGLPVTITQTSPATSAITVTSTLQVTRVAAVVTFSHPTIEAVSLTLRGATLLQGERGLPGNGSARVVFDTAAPLYLSATAPPHVDPVRPDDDLGSVIGASAAGSWPLQLRSRDCVGALEEYSLLLCLRPAAEVGLASCADGLDNDSDGATDCSDDECALRFGCPVPVEQCGNTLDDDGDGAVDCEDADCGCLTCPAGQTLIHRVSTEVPSLVDSYDCRGQTFPLVGVDVGAPGITRALMVQLSIENRRVDDLVVSLIAPDGRFVHVAGYDLYANGPNFVATRFADTARQGLPQSAAPYTGVFRPQEPLAHLIGRPSTGEWQLRVQDCGGSLPHHSYVSEMQLWMCVDTSPTTPDAGVSDAGPTDGGHGDAGVRDDLDPAFGTAGFQALGPGVPGLLTRVDGHIVLAVYGASEARLVRLDPLSGARDLAFGGQGTGDMAVDAPTHRCGPVGVASFGPDRYVILCRADTRGVVPDPGFFTWGYGDVADRRFTATGALDPTYCATGTCRLTDGEIGGDVGLAGAGGMMLWTWFTSHAGLPEARLLDPGAGTRSPLPAMPWYAFNNWTPVRTRGVMGVSSSGGLVLASQMDRGTIGILSLGSPSYFEGFPGWNAYEPVSVTAGVEHVPVFVARSGSQSDVYMIERVYGGRNVPLLDNHFPLGDATAVVADSRGRFYASGSDSSRAYITRLVYYRHDPTLDRPSPGGPAFPAFVLPGRTIELLWYDAPTDSVYFAGVAGGQAYVGKLQL